MRHLHKTIIIVLQFFLLLIIVFIVSGIAGALVYAIGEISLVELVEYLQGLLTGETMGIIGAWLLKKRLDQIIFHFRRKQKHEIDIEARLRRIKKMIK